MNNKTSDKNVGGIEDDIKILENLKSYLNLLIYEGNDKIIYNDLLWDEKTVDCIYAMENLINDYTRQKQINEEHQKTNGELRERVKEVIKEKQELTSALLDSIPIQKIKEIVDECIPKKENIITREIEYTPNVNANSYLVQQILELLQESEDK